MGLTRILCPRLELSTSEQQLRAAFCIVVSRWMFEASLRQCQEATAQPDSILAFISFSYSSTSIQLIYKVFAYAGLARTVSITLLNHATGRGFPEPWGRLVPSQQRPAIKVDFVSGSSCIYTACFGSMDVSNVLRCPQLGSNPGPTLARILMSSLLAPGEGKI